MVIYADEVFAINLIVNYLILLAVSKLCAVYGSRIRMVWGALVGGVYAVIALIVPFLCHPVVKVSVGIVMTLAAFGGHKRILRMILTVFGVSATFAGVIYALTIMMTGTDTSGAGYFSVSFKTLVLAFGVCYLVIDLVFRRLARTASEIVSVTVEYRGKTAVISALKDTGHSLTDPLTGRPVIVAGAEALFPLFDGDDADTLKLPPAESVEKLTDMGHRFRLITYSSVGVDSGLLAAFRPDSVRIRGKLTDCVIAISPNDVSDGGAYSALIGVDYY